MMSERIVREPSLNRNSESVGSPLTTVRSVSLNAPISAGMREYRLTGGADFTALAGCEAAAGGAAGTEAHPISDTIAINGNRRFILSFYSRGSSACLTPKFSCKHATTIAAKPHPKSACQLQRSLDCTAA